MMREQNSHQAQVILCTGEDISRCDVFRTPSWQSQWTAIHESAVGELDDEDSQSISINPGDSLPTTRGVDLTLWISELEQLEAALKQRVRWKRIIFTPSKLALLDETRMRRQTLVAARNLKAGARLRFDDMDLVAGGGGVEARLRDDLIDHVLQYDIARSADITFGYVNFYSPTSDANEGDLKDIAHSNRKGA